MARLELENMKLENPISTWALLQRVVLFAMLWFILSEARWNDFFLILISIAIATLSSLFLWGSRLLKFNYLAIVKFIPYFLWESLLGGVDVARRALVPGATLRPGFIDFPSQLRTEPAKVLFVWIVSLLPGSAGVLIEDKTIRIHALDTSLVTIQQLRKLETKVQAIMQD